MSESTPGHARALATHYERPICRTNVSANDRACTPLPPQNFHGKEGVDGSSPSEGSIPWKNRPQMGGFCCRDRHRGAPLRQGGGRRSAGQSGAIKTPAKQRRGERQMLSGSIWGHLLGTDSVPCASAGAPIGNQREIPPAKRRGRQHAPWVDERWPVSRRRSRVRVPSRPFSKCLQMQLRAAR